MQHEDEIVERLGRLDALLASLRQRCGGGAPHHPVRKRAATHDGAAEGKSKPEEGKFGGEGGGRKKTRVCSTGTKAAAKQGLQAAGGGAARRRRSQTPCTYFWLHGNCWHGHGCSFSHLDPPPPRRIFVGDSFYLNRGKKKPSSSTCPEISPTEDIIWAPCQLSAALLTS